MRKKSKDIDIDTNQVVQEIYCDLCNGATRNDCAYKLQNGMYEIGRYKDRNLGKSQAYRLIQKSVDLMQEESEQERNVMRSQMYNRLLAVYQDSIQNNDRSNAIRAIEVMGKLCGMFNAENQTNVQINSADGEIQINFGFNNDIE